MMLDSVVLKLAWFACRMRVGLSVSAGVIAPFSSDHLLSLFKLPFEHQLASTRYHTFAKTHQTALYPSIITAI
jgi:hypothetical protein